MAAKAIHEHQSEPSRTITESPRQSHESIPHRGDPAAPLRSFAVHNITESDRKDTLGSLDSRRASYPVPRRPPEKQLEGEHKPWIHKNILSLDGGGIRGYYSLLILKQLMDRIKFREQRFTDGTGQETPAASSFSPCNQPPNVSTIPGDFEEQEDRKAFLPCHYFDYICGTSTGGLIAIMLSRLRMTVDDCIAEYLTLGGRVFGKPRHFHQLIGPLVWWERTKYDAARLENVIHEVLGRRGERVERNGQFKSEEGLCRTFAFAYKKTPENRHAKASLEAPYIFRSYDHLSKEPKGILVGHPRNPGRAAPYNIWEVARATTAAPFYFDPFVLSGAQSVKRRTNTFGLNKRTSEIQTDPQAAVFIDGGFGAPNNPAEEAYYEVEVSKEPIGTFVSVGTGRKVTDRFQKGIANKLGAGFEVAGDSETVHESILRLFNRAKRDGNPFSYFRFNEPNALKDTSFDEWEPRSNGRRTIKKMDDAFAQWLTSPEIQDALQNCAEELVRRRRLRTKDFSKWERYALGSCFECRVNGDECEVPSSKWWSYRSDFQDHLVRAHRVDKSNTDRLKKLADENRTGWSYQNPRSNPVN